MMHVPLIKADLPDLESIRGPVEEILKSGKITNFGKYVSAFEEEAGIYLGTRVATVSSGTLSLIMALQALGLERGQKVILPSFTFMATAQAVLYAGGVPIFSEIDDQLTLSPDDLRALLQKHSDASIVLPVHMYGLPCRIQEIERIVEEADATRRKPIAVVYDGAHAFGSSVNGRKVGSFGHAEVFSLSVTKMLVSVEGGLVSSRDPELIRRVRKMRNYGIEENYDARWPGLNGKMSEFHAIIGLYNLRRLDSLVAERQRKARRYLDRIAQRTRFGTLQPPAGATHTFKDFTILMPPDRAERRDRVMAFLKEKGVETRAYFDPPVHKQKFFEKYADRPLPKTESMARRVISLPFFTSITDEQMDYVVDALAEAERIVN